MYRIPEFTVFKARKNEKFESYYSRAIAMAKLKKSPISIITFENNNFDLKQITMLFSVYPSDKTEDIIRQRKLADSMATNSEDDNRKLFKLVRKINIDREEWRKNRTKQLVGTYERSKARINGIDGIIKWIFDISEVSTYQAPDATLKTYIPKNKIDNLVQWLVDATSDYWKQNKINESANATLTNNDSLLEQKFLKNDKVYLAVQTIVTATDELKRHKLLDESHSMAVKYFGVAKHHESKITR